MELEDDRADLGFGRRGLSVGDDQRRGGFWVHSTVASPGFRATDFELTNFVPGDDVDLRPVSEVGQIAFVRSEVHSPSLIRSSS